MDLWIRSQDKERLLISSHLDTYCIGKHPDDNVSAYWVIEDCGVDLGQYATKERALEVLDEIQKRICINEFISHNLVVKEDMSEKDQNITANLVQEMIYQMPEE